ncbi:ABC transporter substrate-binding protein [Gorillibacterium timonense]|uniref:ABC transporter substrate-binding protein n=1 Tax=Gorillibacterium timonense TaxID=1689269 RepID=UPI000B326AB8|nr:ABC transporter substrate-binding protein [Gorillibacterium timonense]
MNLMKTTIRSGLILTTIALALAGCGKTDNTDKASDSGSPAKEPVVVSLGMLPSIDEIPFVIAHQQGFDTKHGVTFDIETFKSAKDRDAAFQAGKLDAISADLVAISIYNQAGMDVKIASTTIGGFSLLTGNDSIQSVADLKGKSVIFSKNTSTEYTLSRMLEQAGLTEGDIQATEVPQIPTRLELLKNGKADAAILPEPFVTMGKAAGLRVLSSTKDAGVDPFVLGIPQKVLDTKKEAIQNMYAAYNEAVDYMKAHDQADYLDVVIKEVGYPESLKAEITVPEYPHAVQMEEAQVEAAFSWAKTKGLLKKDLAPKDVISDAGLK